MPIRKRSCQWTRYWRMCRIWWRQSLPKSEVHEPVIVSQLTNYPFRVVRRSRIKADGVLIRIKDLHVLVIELVTIGPMENVPTSMNVLYQQFIAMVENAKILRAVISVLVLRYLSILPQFDLDFTPVWPQCYTFSPKYDPISTSADHILTLPCPHSLYFLGSRRNQWSMPISPNSSIE